MSNLYEIAQAIMEPADAEYRALNLASAETVSDYALNCLGFYISTAQAELVRTTLQGYLDAEHNTSNSWLHMVKKPLTCA